MKNKTILITGATSGIGQSAATTLAGMGATTVLVARNEAKGKATLQKIQNKHPKAQLDLFLADLSSTESIKSMASSFMAKYDRLDVLLNNAGGLIPKKQTSADGYEYTFALNHLGYFTTTLLLLDLLKKSEPSRIINVSSSAHQMGKLNFNDLHFEQTTYNDFNAYCNSKLMNVLFTYELDRRLKGSGVSVNALHPGVVSTNFGAGSKGFFGVMIALAKPFMIDPKKGADTAVYLASSPDVEGISGKYFVKRKARPTIGLSYDEAIAKQLWQVSCELTGVC